MQLTKASLTVVGSGIKSISHLTVEAKVHVEQADRVLYIVNHPVLEDWIKKTHRNARSIYGFYFEHKLRKDAYQAMTNCMMNEVKKNQHVCVVLYGHPTVFAQPALEAVIQLKKEGYPAWILPGISAEDCLFADLCIDPGSSGCQSFEATDFLVRPRSFDIKSHLVLWQVGMIGCITLPSFWDNRKGAEILSGYLSEFYPTDHQAILYEAAVLPNEDPKIDRFPLHQLSERTFSSASTLYIPPLGRPVFDLDMLKKLEIPSSLLNSSRDGHSVSPKEDLAAFPIDKLINP